MNWNQSKTLTCWFNNLLRQYTEFKDKSKSHHCKIINIEIESKTNQTTLFVLVNGIKKQIIPFSPEKIVINDELLNQFSSSDVRAITFFAVTQTEPIHKPSHIILRQEFMEGRTFFIIKNIHIDDEEKKSAHELYCDNNILTKFNYNDLKTIISTAIQEQAVKDFQIIKDIGNHVYQQ